MPRKKCPWTTTKKRKKGKKGNNSNSVQRAECHRPILFEQSTTKELITNEDLSNPAVKEESTYPDTRFKQSTTLFPAIGVITDATELTQNGTGSKTQNGTLKRSAEEVEVSKKAKIDQNTIVTSPGTVGCVDSPKPPKLTVIDDVTIVQNTPKKVEIDLIDLTVDSCPVFPIICTPTRTSFMENRLPGKLSTALRLNGNFRVKRENDDLQTKLGKENEINQVCGSNTVLDCIAEKVTDATNTDNHLSLKKEQIENHTASDHSTSVLNFSSVVDTNIMDSNNLPIKNELNKATENLEFSESCTADPNPSSISSTEILSKVHIATKHLSNVFNQQQTKEKPKDGIKNSLVSTDETQNTVSCAENKTGSDSSINFLVASTQVKNEPEKMDFLDSPCNYEQQQNCEETSNINTNSGSERTWVVAPEPLAEDGLNLASISPQSDGFISDDGGCMSHEQLETFRTPLLKYQKCNTEINLLEISHALSAIGSEEHFDSLENFKLNHREKSTDLQISEKESVNLDEILQKIASCPNFKELSKSNIINLDANSVEFPSEMSIDETERNSLNNEVISNELRQNNPPNLLFESVSNQEAEKNLIAPRDLLLKSVSNEAAEKNHNGELFSKDFLLQILGNAKSTPEIPQDIVDSDSSVNTNLMIEENIFENLRQINYHKDKPVGTLNTVFNINENSEHIETNLNSFSHTVTAPKENAFKQRQGAFFNPPDTNDDTFETPAKRAKIHEDTSVSKVPKVKKLSYDEYRKRGTRMRTTSSDWPPSDFQSNSMESSSGSPFEQNVHTPIGSHQNHSHPECNATSLRNHNNQRLVSTSFKDPRLARSNSSGHKNIESQKQSKSFNINGSSPLKDVLGNAQSSYRAHPKSTSSVSDTNANQHSPSAHFISEPYQPSDFNQQTFKPNRHGLVPIPSSVNNSFSLSQHYPGDSVNGLKNRHPRGHLPPSPSNASPSSQPHHIMSPETHPQSPRYSVLNHNRYPSVSANQEFILNPPLPTSEPPPLPPLPPIIEPLPLPPLPPVIEPCPPLSTVVELFHSNASNRSPNSANYNHTNVAATKHPISEFKFVSLLPTQVKENIGKNILPTDHVYLIIIERNIEWIEKLEKEKRAPKISDFGCEFQHVRSDYENHIVHYNTYFPHTLLECISKISLSLNKLTTRDSTDRNFYRFVEYKANENHASVVCDSFVHHSHVESIPKEGNIVLLKFATNPVGSVSMLGYVTYSATRAYSHKHDYKNYILNYVNVHEVTDLIKCRIVVSIVFQIPINRDLPIQISKLTSLKRALMINEALKGLSVSPLCNTVLNPRKHEIKKFELPRRQEKHSLTTVIQKIVQSLNTSSPRLIAVKSTLFADSFLAIDQIIHEIQKCNLPGKILVCVRSEMLSQMGMNLSSNKMVIINRERESLHEDLRERVLDVKISRLSKTENIPNNVARTKVLREIEVVLAVTGTCYYEDVKSIAKDLTYCIIHDAHTFTEPESLVPLLYGIRHLLLFGDPGESCHVNSWFTARLGYNISLFQRIYSLH